MLGPTVRPQSPPAATPTAAEEEDGVEEIVHDEPRTQSVRILRKRGDEVVVVKEEDTPREMRRLKSTHGGVVKQIKVNTEPRIFFVDIVGVLLSLSLCISRG